jgi:chaperone BCS1
MNLDPTLLLLITSGGLLMYFKNIPRLIYNKVKSQFVYSVKVYQYDELFLILENWLYDHHKSAYKDVEASLQDEDSSPGRSHHEIKRTLIYKQEENDFFIKYNNKKLIISKSKEKMDKAESAKDFYFRKYTLSGFRAKEHIDLLLKEAVKYNEAKKNVGIYVYSNDSYGNWSSPKTIKVKSWDKVILEKNAKDLITKDLQEFLSSEKWYMEASIAYKRGYGLHGPPGTGKTTLALAIACYTNRPVYCMNLNSIENDSRIPYMFSEMRNNSILLLEDIDRVFSGRDNVRDDSKITFSTFLNCLDGAFSKHGVITIITTNHLDKLDPALLRTGRIDLLQEIPKPTVAEVAEYLSIFYGKPVTLEGYDNDWTMSDIQEICIKNKTNVNKAIETLQHH